MMAQVRKSRKAFGLVRRVLSSASGDSVATLNGRLDVPFCADTGSDENIISLKTIKDLQALDPTVDVEDLATPWKGCAVDDQPVYAKQVAKLRVQLHTKAGRVNLPGLQSCYVINSSDDFIISRGALESIGIDMNRLLEQVAEHQSLEDGDDVGESDEGDDITFGVEIRHVRGNLAELDREDRAAAEDLVQDAIVELKKSSEDDEKEIATLWKVVLEAANGGVWRAKFRGTDEPADVPAMRIKLKPNYSLTVAKSARPTRSKRSFLKRLADSLKATALFLRTPRLLKASGEWTQEELLLYYRLTIDYRTINSMTVAMAGAMPFQFMVLESVRDAKFLGIFDLTKGFWQLPLAKDSQEILSFMLAFRVMTPTRVMQGHCDSASFFQNTMTECLRPLLYKHCLVWIDDILVWANSLADYVDVLRQLFAICEKHRLRLNPAKSTLLCHEIKWCGRIIDGNGVRQDPERMEALCNIPYPTDAGQLQQFICAVNWVRDSLIGFAQAVHPLQKRLTQALEGKKRRKRIASSIAINLTDEEKSSWNDVKDLLRSSVQLCHPDESATMCLFTDASKDGWSIVVTQVREFDEEIPVHEQQHEMLVCQSGMFDKTQMNWSVIEKEGYPIARACDSLKYLLLRPLGFRMYCDHKNLIHVFAPNAELKTHTRDKLLRWADIISQYRYEIEHIDGVHNLWADLMSRRGQPAPMKSHVNRLRVDEPPCFAETSISRRTSRRYARALKQWTKRRKRQSHNFVYKPPQAKFRPLDDPEFIWPDTDSIIDAQQRHTAPRTAILHDDGKLY
ncbi:hypothetical protein Ae201684P_014414 [Aphanomyces euteiches]|nr:hypothetical protein Ae201684P_014414 [Aphanomyces euteiches]